MSGSVNKVILVGCLGGDPEVSGSRATMSIATSRKVIHDDGTKEDVTTWHRVKVMGALATSCEKYLKKGSRVYVEGLINNYQYKTDTGETRYGSDVLAREVQFLNVKE